MKLEELQKEKNAVLVSTEAFCCFVQHELITTDFPFLVQAKIMEIKRNRPGGKKDFVVIVLIRFFRCNGSVDLTSINSLLVLLRRSRQEAPGVRCVRLLPVHF